MDLARPGDQLKERCMTKNRAMVIETSGVMPVEVERSVPDPGPGEVLVKVGGSSMNSHDVANLFGMMPGPFPRVPMTDGAGQVAAIGEGTERFRIGDRVVGAFYPEWREGPPVIPSLDRYIPGDSGDGWLQQFVCTSEATLVAAPPHLSYPEAATLVCAGTTAWSAIQAGGVGPGDTVVTLGTGGVSIFVVQIAQACGARVIITSSSDEKLARAGADEAINYQEHPAWDEEVLRLTDGRGADLVVDLGGTETLQHSINAARTGGTVIMAGVLSGFGLAEIPVATALQHNLRIQAVTVGSVHDHANFSAFVSEHELVPKISHLLPWEELSEAVRVMVANEHVGKIAITIP